MDLKIKNRHAVIFGGTKGIGKAIAECFIEEGTNVSICGRNNDDLQQALQILQNSTVNVNGSVVDITKKETIQSWAATLEKELGKIDFLILNASALSADWETSIETDMKGTINSIAIFLPLLQKSDIASIVYIGSKAASIGTPYFEAYGATKAAMTHYMKSLSQKLTSAGIRVNTISPGDTFVKDGFWDKIKTANPEVYEATEKGNKLGRFCTPEEIADAVVFLASPRASYISGSNLLIDGESTNHVRF